MAKATYNSATAVKAVAAIPSQGRPETADETRARFADPVEPNPTPADNPGEAPFSSRLVTPARISTPKSDADDTFYDEVDDMDNVPISQSSPVITAPNNAVITAYTPAPAQTVDRLAKYTAKKKRVTFRLESGMVMMTVIDVIRSVASILVILPSQTDGCVFIPSAGEMFRLEYDGQSYECSAPGIVHTIDDLGLTVLTLIMAKVIGASDAKTE